MPVTEIVMVSGAAEKKLRAKQNQVRISLGAKERLRNCRFDSNNNRIPFLDDGCELAPLRRHSKLNPEISVLTQTKALMLRIYGTTEVVP